MSDLLKLGNQVNRGHISAPITTKITIEGEDCVYILHVEGFHMREESLKHRNAYQMDGGDEFTTVNIEGVLQMSEMYQREKNHDKG